MDSQKRVDLCKDKKHIGFADCAMAFNIYRDRSSHDPYIHIPLRELRERSLCTSIFLKRLIARLRRTQNRKQWSNDWAQFKTIFEFNYKYWINIASFTTLISIADTYIDHAKPDESKQAMIIITMVGWEKFTRTRLKFTEDKKLNNNELRKLREYYLSDYGYGFVQNGDMPSNLFKRLNTCITSPVLRAVFHAILTVYLNNESTPKDLIDLGYVKYHEQYKKLIAGKT